MMKNDQREYEAWKARQERERATNGKLPYNPRENEERAKYKPRHEEGHSGFGW